VSHEPRLIALLGWPAGHSLSPAMHNAAFRALHLPYEYRAMDVPPRRLGEAIDELRGAGFAGGNVTLPHKRIVMGFCDELDEMALRVGAVNTLVNQDGRLRGGNTDVAGVRAALQEAGVDLAGARVLVLGAGGAARAVVLAVHLAGGTVAVVARDAEHAAAIAREGYPWEAQALGKVVRGVRLVVNAASVMEGNPPPCDVPLRELPRDAVVFDLVYRPLETPLLAAARRLGLRTIDGARMLLHQGAESFRMWTGKEAPLGAMEAALHEAIAPEQP
jgi:shikimate dehydrogenase